MARLGGDDADRLPVEPGERSDDLPGVELLDLEDAALVDDGADQLHHVVAVGGLLGHDRCGIDARLGGDPLIGGRKDPVVVGHVGEVRPRPLDRLLVRGHQSVAAPGHLTVHPGAAHLLERRLLADHHLGHPRRAEVHGGPALDHDDDVAERRDVGPAGRRGAHETADLGHPARQAHLVVEDLARPSPPGEQIDLVGDAGSGGVDEVEDRQQLVVGGLEGTDDLLHGEPAPRAGFHGRVVRDHDDRPAVDEAAPGDDPVR